MTKVEREKMFCSFLMESKSFPDEFLALAFFSTFNADKVRLTKVFPMF